MQNFNPEACDPIKILMMQALDHEISAGDEAKLTAHLKECSRCRAEFQKMQNLKEVTIEMKKSLLPEMVWDEYWRHLYNRLERGVAWIFISIGAIIVLGFAAVQFVQSVLNESDLNSLEKFGILTLTFGFVVLLISVLREKLMLRSHDKYREVQR